MKQSKTVYFTNAFKKDYKRELKTHRNLDEIFEDTLRILTEGGQLPIKYRDHALTGDWKSYRECHLMPDLLLVYRYDNDKNAMYCVRIGSHSELRI